MVFTGNMHQDEFICTCEDDKICRIHKLMKSKKETQGKRTSEGYEPKPGEKVEVRGD